MPLKSHQTQNYEEIDIIDYLRTIKHHFSAISGITIGTIVFVVIATLWLVEPVKYENEATISIGMHQGQPIETPDEVIDLLVYSYKNVSARKGSLPREIVIYTEGSSAEEVEQNIKSATDGLLAHHDNLHETGNKKRSSEITTLQERIKQQEEILNRYQQMVQKLSSSHEAQAIVLQNYLSSYGGVVEKISILRTKIEELQLQQSDYRATQLVKEPATSKKVSTNITTNLIGGLFLGIVIGIIWAFAKDWWDVNKRLLK